MRVLHLNAGNLFGGIEVNLLTLARFAHLCPGTAADYGVCFDVAAAAGLRAAGATVHVLGGVRLSRPWTVLAARRRLAAVLRRTRYDVVVCHEAWVHAVFAPVVRRAGPRLVFWAHDRHPAPLGWLDRLAARTRPDRVVVNSQYSAAAGLFPGVPSEVVYCPVAPLPVTADRAAVRRRFDTPADAVVIVQVGRWERHKGHLAHVAALGRLRELPGWVCWQVGAPQRPAESAYQAEVRAAAGRAGVADRVRFVGWQPDLGAVLAAADVYCQPNTAPEPFGIALVEALYAGLPVVASDEAGPREIIAPECGILAPPGDVAAVADALAGLIRDPARRRALGRAGPPRARALCDPATQLGKLAAALRA
ncbi:MAG: glycosyltransferase family 4 protein [Gemmataceae bacterium]